MHFNDNSVNSLITHKKENTKALKLMFLRISNTLIALLFFNISHSQINQVLSFDGFDDRIEVTEDGTLSTLQQFTIEVWVNISEYGIPHVVYRGTSDYLIENFKVGIKDGEPELRINGGTANNQSRFRSNNRF